MVSRASVVPCSMLKFVTVVGLVVGPSAPGNAAFLSVFNVAGATAEATNELTSPPDLQNASQSGDTGTVTSSVTADRGAASRFAVGTGLSWGTIDFGYFAGTADSLAIVPRGMITTDGTGREYEYFASSYADVVADSTASFLVMPANPMLIGTLGTLVVPIDVHGTVSATTLIDPARAPTNASAQVQWSMGAGTTSGIAPAMLFGMVDMFGSIGDAPGPHTLIFDVVLGVPTVISLHYEMHTTAGLNSSLGVGGRAEGLAAFGSTFRWMGISQVLDFDGNPIDYAITSDAGFDWTQAAPTPVPVPPLASSLLLAVLGSGALFGRRRRVDRDVQIAVPLQCPDRVAKPQS